MTTLQNTHTFSSDRAGRTKRFAALPALAAAFTALLIIGCGGGSSSSSSSPAPANPAGPAPSAASKTIAVYAGSAGGSGFVDGPANIAHFGSPTGLVFDGQGNLLVADMDAKAIRKVNTATGETSTWAGELGTESAFDGPPSEARFTSNCGMVRASNGTIYLTDSFLCGVRTISPLGFVSTLVGCSGVVGYQDGVGPNAWFAQPFGLALDEAQGYLYVVDYLDCAIRRVNIATTETTTLAGVPRHANERTYRPSTVDGPFETARFNGPRNVVGPVDGALYVACDESIRKVDLATRMVTTVAGTPNVRGFADGVGANVRFNRVSGLALDGKGHLLITEGGSTNDYCGQVLRSLDLANGQVTTLAGTGSEVDDPLWGGGAMGLGGWADGVGGAVRFNMPFSLAVDAIQNVAYITEAGNAVIRKMNLASGEISTLAGIGPQVGAVDGPAAKAAFRLPYGLILDAQGNAYVADADNHLIRKITAQGVVSTLAGRAGVHGCDDGPAASATFNTPEDLALDAQGNLFVVDVSNHCIRKITPDGTVSTFAGTPGNPGWADGPGDSAQFNRPRGIVLGPDGNLYVPDSENNMIRRITPDGTVSTFAGSGEYSFNDGVGTEAAFYTPRGIINGASGNLLVADTGNGAIRSIDLATGAVTTLAGNGEPGAMDGEGSAARFNQPTRLVVDPRGFLLVSDSNNHAIRKLTYAGTVTTVVGTLKDGKPSLMGIKLGDLPGQITYPAGMAIAPDGSLLVESDNCILKITGIE